MACGAEQGSSLAHACLRDDERGEPETVPPFPFNDALPLRW